MAIFVRLDDSSGSMHCDARLSLTDCVASFKKLIRRVLVLFTKPVREV